MHPQDDRIRALYIDFIDGWNRRSGAAVAAAFADDGDIIGFDGSHHHGRLAIAADLRQIFGSHQTPAYVALIRSVRQITPDVAVLMAHAGMIPPGGNDLDPALLTVHTVIAVEESPGRCARSPIRGWASRARSTSAAVHCRAAWSAVASSDATSA